MANQTRDMTGMTFGTLTVECRAPNKIYRFGAYWTCVCSCGKRTDVFGSDLRSGKVAPCACVRVSQPRVKFAPGDTFGVWTLVERRGEGLWLCRCECGHEAVMTGLRKASTACTHAKRFLVRAGMPSTRGECQNRRRPCPYTSCAMHLGFDGTETCTLDVADRGGVALAEVGEAMGISRERARQIEESALRKLRKAESVALDGEDRITTVTRGAVSGDEIVDAEADALLAEVEAEDFVVPEEDQEFCELVWRAYTRKERDAAPLQGDKFRGENPFNTVVWVTPKKEVA